MDTHDMTKGLNLDNISTKWIRDFNNSIYAYQNSKIWLERLQDLVKEILKAK